MERFYWAGTTKVPCEELEGIVALRAGGASAAAGGTSYGMPLEADTRAYLCDASPVGERCLAAFENANWRFARTTDEAYGSVRAGAIPDAASNAGYVCRSHDGDLYVTTRRLNIRLSAALSPKEATQRLADAGLRLVHRLRFAPNLFEVEVMDARDPLDVSNYLCPFDNWTPGHPLGLDSLRDRVLYAEPVFIEHVPERVIPNDPGFSDQKWQWDRISAMPAWEITQGDGVRIAVIDNGFVADHSDLVPIVDASGRFLLDGTFIATKEDFNREKHGTFCAGMAAATLNNETGGCGAAPGAELLLIQVLEDQLGTQQTLALAVAYAADPSLMTLEEHVDAFRELEPVVDGRFDAAADALRGADVISCSLGSAPEEKFELFSVLKDAISFAVQHGRGGRGTPVFWATNNGNVSMTLDAVTSQENVIAVGRTTKDDLRADLNDTRGGSAFGRELDFMAPGVEVHSTQLENAAGNFGTGTGTSFATPCAAGVGALVLSVFPEARWEDVKQILRDTCDKVGDVDYVDGRNDQYGFGRVNAERAVREAQKRRAQRLGDVPSSS